MTNGAVTISPCTGSLVPSDSKALAFNYCTARGAWRLAGCGVIVPVARSLMQFFYFELVFLLPDCAPSCNTISVSESAPVVGGYAAALPESLMTE